MVGGVPGEGPAPAVGHSFAGSRRGGARRATGKRAEDLQSAVAKDSEPLVKFAGVSPQHGSDAFWAVASSNSPEGGETFVDPPIQRGFAPAIDLLALLNRQDYGCHG